MNSQCKWAVAEPTLRVNIRTTRPMWTTRKIQLRRFMLTGTHSSNWLNMRCDVLCSDDTPNVSSDATKFPHGVFGVVYGVLARNGPSLASLPFVKAQTILVRVTEIAILCSARTHSANQGWIEPTTPKNEPRHELKTKTEMRVRLTLHNLVFVMFMFYVDFPYFKHFALASLDMDALTVSMPILKIYIVFSIRRGSMNDLVKKDDSTPKQVIQSKPEATRVTTDLNSESWSPKFGCRFFFSLDLSWFVIEPLLIENTMYSFRMGIGTVRAFMSKLAYV